VGHAPRRAEGNKLVPPATPLVACDPYFSIWSPADKLTDADTMHWTGKPHRLTSMVRIDGRAFRVMGASPASVPALAQTSLIVLPTRTIYTFEGVGVALTLTFLTPALPEDIDILSRPVTYVTYDFRATDGKTHDVAFYFEASAEITVNDARRQQVIWSKAQIGDLTSLRVGSQEQAVLAKKTYGSSAGEHVQLIKEYAVKIRDFLLGSTAAGAGLVEALRHQKDDPPRGNLVILVRGRSQPWILAPSLAGAGISPSTGAYSNAWPGAAVEVEAYGASFQLSEAPAGLYQASLGTFPGETVVVSAQFVTTNQGSVTELRWIGSSNGVSFGLLLDPRASNAVTLLPVLAPPQDLASFPSNGMCHLGWLAAADTNATAYRIYGRRSDESLFALLGATTNCAYNSGHSWVSGTKGEKWFYTVVAVSTNGAESPYPDIVKNSQPPLARFGADVVSGTPPLAVTFTNQSLGSVTNWAWDFDSDGTVDSTDANPSVVFAEPGSYSVTLTVTGADGPDTTVAVGYVSVWLPRLGVARVLPDRAVDLTIYGQAGRAYEIQASTDLQAWTGIADLTLTNAAVIFRDTAATNLSQRFYRAAIP